ncbi:hypothetical protein HDU76_002428 [Blyttiomyces sp. JEL0837]|nr:hypothetical protein HDU76_002428 [Blyttiomyces sp. JEL0837]
MGKSNTPSSAKAANPSIKQFLSTASHKPSTATSNAKLLLGSKESTIAQPDVTTAKTSPTQHLTLTGLVTRSQKKIRLNSSATEIEESVPAFAPRGIAVKSKDSSTRPKPAGKSISDILRVNRKSTGNDSKSAHTKIQSKTSTTPKEQTKKEIAEEESRIDSTPPKTPPSNSVSTPTDGKPLSPFMMAIMGKRKRAEEDDLGPFDPFANSPPSLLSPNSPHVPRRTEFNSPIPRANVPATPAHLRYKPLLTSSPSSPSSVLLNGSANGANLPLPASYALLDKFFHALEFSVSFLRGRDQPAVFHKFRRPVENMSGRTFTIDHLEQIRSVFPEAYRYEACRTRLDGTEGGCRENAEAGDWVDSVRLEMVDYLKEKKMMEESGKEKDKEGNGNASENYDVKEGVGKVYQPWGDELVKRRLVFRERLVERVKKEHSKFLESISFQTRDEVTSELRAWHPKFDLEGVPEVERTPMPQVERRKSMVLEAKTVDSELKVGDKLKIVSSAAGEANGMDGSVTGKSEVGNDIEKAKKCDELVGLASGSCETDGEVKGPGTSKETTEDHNADVVKAQVATAAEEAAVETSKKPLSRAAALLARIRDKERRNEQELMYKPKHTPEEIRKRAMMSRMEEVAKEGPVIRIVKEVERKIPDLKQKVTAMLAAPTTAAGNVDNGKSK